MCASQRGRVEPPARTCDLAAAIARSIDRGEDDAGSRVRAPDTEVCREPITERAALFRIPRRHPSDNGRASGQNNSGGCKPSHGVGNPVAPPASAAERRHARECVNSFHWPLHRMKGESISKFRVGKPSLQRTRRRSKPLVKTSCVIYPSERSTIKFITPKSKTLWKIA